MKQAFIASAPSWLRGALLLALLAIVLPAIPGCAEDVNPMQSGQDQTAAPDFTSLSLAPDFCPSLPAHDVVVIHNQPGPGTLFDLWFWGIGSGYDVADGFWPGWCLEDNGAPNVKDPGTVTMWCSYDDALPGNLGDLPINELNYLLNHRYGDYKEVQAAIWLLTWGGTISTFPPTANSYAMRDAALANGAGYVPGPGELIAVFLYTGDGGIAPGPEGFQDTMIEVRLPGTPPPPPPPGGDACTPGYWRTHFSRWPAPYSPGDDFDATFGTNYFEPNITLGDAIWLGGGGVKKLARHGTAALLNAAHGEVGYPYSVAEVIALVQAGDADLLADTNDELECPLGGTSADPQEYLGGN